MSDEEKNRTAKNMTRYIYSIYVAFSQKKVASWYNYLLKFIE